MRSAGILLYPLPGAGLQRGTYTNRNLRGRNRKKEDSALVKFRELPEITAACIFHKGSYDNFPDTYAAILRFIEENGYEICGNIRENYIDGIWNKDREEDWLSEIQIPVRVI